jgi:hypothetical protein
LAEIQIEGDDFVVVLGRLEKLEAAHGDLRVPLSAVRDIEVVDRPLDVLQGLKLIGSGLPGTAVGTWISPDGRTFAVEHHASRGLVIHLEGQSYKELIIGSDDPEALMDKLRRAAPNQSQ